MIRKAVFVLMDIDLRFMSVYCPRFALKLISSLKLQYTK